MLGLDIRNLGEGRKELLASSASGSCLQVVGRAEN
jgi:hypothetical protein